MKTRENLALENQIQWLENCLRNAKNAFRCHICSGTGKLNHTGYMYSEVKTEQMSQTRDKGNYLTL